MTRTALSWLSRSRASPPRVLGWLHVLIPLPLVVGCASGRDHENVVAPPTPPPEVSQAGFAARILAPNDPTRNPAESVVKPGNPGQVPTLPSGSQTLEAAQITFALPDAIAFALQNSPRLRAARAAIERARGQEQVAFAPFLPQVDLLGQSGVTSATLAPGILGPTGFLLAGNYGTRSYSEAEVSLQWTLYDFGRTGGRYRVAGAREQIAELQLARTSQTVEFDVAAAYMDVLLAHASCRVQEDAVRRGESILEDTMARRKGGVALREDVLRAQVQISESREALVLAREHEFDAVARLNNTMGRNASCPLQVVELETQPASPRPLPELLERAAAQRPEVGLARQAVAAGQDGWQAARADFLPRIFVRGSAGRTDGENVISGWQEGVGLHLESPLYAGGQHRGELRSAAADIEAAIADGQTILDAISLQVNLAYRGVAAANERIALSRIAVVQADENLRLVRVRYRNGDATPTDIVDSEAALTRSQQRFFSATYTYLAALARLNYTLGAHAGDLPANADAVNREEVPLPRPGRDER
jgi:outer membrane protein